jgi:hypothetical protein
MANTEVRARAVFIESEATSGTDPTPTDAFSTLGDAPRVMPQTVPVENESVIATQDGLAHKGYQSHNDVNIEAYLFGKSGAAGTSPVQIAIFHAAGFGETPVVSTSSTLTPITSHTDATAPSMTVYEEVYHTNGQMRRGKASGVRGNLVLDLQMDTYAKMTFTGVGLFAELASLASGTAPALTAYDGGKDPMLVRGITFDLDGSSYCVTGMDLNTNWSVEENRCGTGTSSLDSVHLVRGAGSRMGGTLSAQDAAALDAIIAAIGADSELDLSVTLTDGTDTIEISMTIQFGQYERSGGNLGSYSFPYFVVGSPEVVFT